MDKFSPIESEQAHSFQNIQRLYFPPFYKQKQTGFANLFFKFTASAAERYPSISKF